MKTVIIKPVTIDENLEGKEVFFTTFYGDLWRASVIRQYVDPLTKKIRIIVKRLWPVVEDSMPQECSACFLQEAIDENRISLFDCLESENPEEGCDDELLYTVFGL